MRATLARGLASQCLSGWRTSHAPAKVSRMSMVHVLDKRELMGFAAAPLPFLVPVLATHASILSTAPPDSAVILFDMLVILCWGYGITLLIGIPIHLALRRVRQQRLFAYIALAAIAALLAGCVLAVLEALLPPLPPERNPFGLTMWSRFGVAVTIAFAVTGSVSAWIFWKIAVSNKPI